MLLSLNSHSNPPASIASVMLFMEFYLYNMRRQISENIAFFELTFFLMGQGAVAIRPVKIHADSALTFTSNLSKHLQPIPG